MIDGGLLIADSYLSWIPAFGPVEIVGISAICAVIFVLVHVLWGRAVGELQIGMAMLRLAAFGILLMILLGPTIVDEQPGDSSRSPLMLLYDGSSSMALGQEQTRWEQCQSFVQNARAQAGETKSQNCPEFRFGHRLEPLSKPESSASDDQEDTDSNADSAPANVSPPVATDSRLSDALRQMLSRLDPRDTDSLVLLSDGRVRSAESVEALAEHFGELSVPIHVVPVGKSQGTGDIAIVSLGTQTEVRKFTENEVQVFFRSFGFTGQRTTVRLLRKNDLAGGKEVTESSIPVTLAGGPQSASLKYRVNIDPLDLVAVIDPIEGELSDNNNRVSTHIDVDRTKLRVLYVEGSSAQASLLARAVNNFRGINTVDQSYQLETLRQALQQDEDIECITLISNGGRTAPVGTRTLSTSVVRFPTAQSELFAFDCIVLSNVFPRALEDEQLKRVAQWVDGRGGGLIITGEDALQPEEWLKTPLQPIMPVDFDTIEYTSPSNVKIKVVQDQHPIWQLSAEDRGNHSILSSLPAVEVSIDQLKTRPTVEILATADNESETPVLLSHRFGRGRVIASTVDLGGSSLSVLSSSWGEESSQHIGKFWRNMVYWATEGSSVGRRRLVANSDKRFYRPGDALTIRTTAYDESARKTNNYRVYAMFEPVSLDDMSLYSPVLWPENVLRESGETGPRLAWGEELLLPTSVDVDNEYALDLMLSESTTGGDNGMRIELTAYEGEESANSFGHGTQVDSSSLEIQVLNDPFEQRNPLPNRELLARIAKLSGGQVFDDPSELAKIMQEREEETSAPRKDLTPAWSGWWLWVAFVSLLTGEWIWRRLAGMA